MLYTLNKECSLRGWKNIPYSIEFETSSRSPLPIDRELTEKLSAPLEYEAGDPRMDSLIRQGILVPCGEDHALSPGQQYRDHECLHFDTVIFSITGRCNYRCMHCSVNAPESPAPETPLPRICQLLDEMKECGLKNVVLIGGEPLIHKDFLQIVDEVSVRGMFITEIFSNGSLVTPALLDELERRGIRTTFMLSFDGVGYHDRMRGVPGAEENFYRCVRLLRERQFPVACNMCITRESVQTIWPTIEKLSAMGVRSLTVYPPVECGLWAGKAGTMGVTTEMIGEEYSKVIERFVAAGYPMDLNMYGMIYFSSALRKYALTPKWRNMGTDPDRTPACVTFARELNISPEGILSPCYALMSDEYVRREMPNLHRMSLKQALTDSAFTRIMEITQGDVRRRNGKCASCEFLSMCGGGCRLSAFKKTGDFMGYDPQMCEFFENGFDQKFMEAIRNGREKRECRR